MIIGKINDKLIDDISITGIDEKYIDSSVKLAILTTVAGYLEKDEISIDGKPPMHIGHVNKFLSYILNDSRAAPRIFRINTKFTDGTITPIKNQNDYDVLLSFSGGIDSTAGLLLALDQKLKVKPIFISFGQKNEKEEIETVRNILAKLNIELTTITIDIDKYIDHDWKRWKLGIIPARNYLFAAFAASILSNSSKKKPQIWVCAHKEEINPINTDKSKRFFRSGTKIFSEYYERTILLSTPFMSITKPEILSYWGKNWAKKYNLTVEDTISCYFGNNCGVCKACINRAIAFTCAGIKVETYKISPFADTTKLIWHSYIERFPTLKKERRIDFLYALKINEGSLPPALKKFVNEHYDEYKKDITRRIKIIQNIEIIS